MPLMKCESLFEEANRDFARLLVLEKQDDLPFYLERFRLTLKSIEASAPTELDPKLFIEIFQFSKLVNDHVWNEVPKLYELIGKSLSVKSDYEEVFRNDIIDLELGILLEFSAT
jgi:hypothetical protein